MVMKVLSLAAEKKKRNYINRIENDISNLHRILYESPSIVASGAVRYISLHDGTGGNCSTM
jgi:hypothetical protein